MPTVKDALAHAKFLIDKGRGEEACVLYLPRLEAQKRKANKEERRRVVFTCDPQTYSDWNTQRDRWIELCGGNPTIAYPMMCRVLAAISDEAIGNMYRDEQQEPE